MRRTTVPLLMRRMYIPPQVVTLAVSTSNGVGVKPCEAPRSFGRMHAPATTHAATQCALAQSVCYFNCVDHKTKCKNSNTTSRDTTFCDSVNTTCISAKRLHQLIVFVYRLTTNNPVYSPCREQVHYYQYANYNYNALSVLDMSEGIRKEGPQRTPDRTMIEYFRKLRSLCMG